MHVIDPFWRLRRYVDHKKKPSHTIGSIFTLIITAVCLTAAIVEVAKAAVS